MRSSAGFAVVDLETTGMYSGGHDRVIEVGVVHVTVEGRIEGQWDTLLNPQRSLGAQHIHGITAAEVLRAPTFEQIAGELADLLAGRAIVAHNLRFDAGFLRAEYGRIGVDAPLPHTGGLCTMTLAKSYLPGSRRRLADCCAAFGITNLHEHRALTDALATAELLGGYLTLDPRGTHWADALTHAATASWPVLARSGTPWFPREAVPDAEPHFLTRIVEQLPDTGRATDHTDYFAAIDRALLDRHISVTEADSLVALAGKLGIDQPTARQLHEAYLRELARTVWSNGVITDGERADLRCVAMLLGLDAGRVEVFLAQAQATNSHGNGTGIVAGQFRLQLGDLVVFTGEMVRPRDEWEAEATDRGLVVHPAVTKKVKLVVADDPDSLSSKARKARQYDIPIITEAAFERMLGRLPMARSHYCRSRS